ncbi:hypothetical protein BDP27DRAFT_598595 [Rhodocollybia butyracea]|uniref:Uncharacterized protein n=1 Tax=Rhodocollybia butyracea TaxID=206335 RepID=A0A9P5Q8C7_9AGAR|nr:hypothetical protein BDP27DRAFT_598595 [Rhodocollybia butyracea]
MSSSAHNLHLVNSSLARRRYPLRNSSPSARKRGQKTRPTSNGFHASDLRPVLVPLHPNLRRLPSRTFLSEKASESTMNPRVGSKRKRVASGGNENAVHGNQPTRGSGRSMKRFKTARRSSETSEDDELSSMDVDTESQRGRRRGQVATDTESEEGDDDSGENESVDDDDESSDDYLISSAPSRVLSRMRKDDLVRLYGLAGLTDDAETLTKSDIVEAIITARDDIASLPPSSPLGRGSSDYSSDDAIVPDEQATPMPNLRRRVTLNNEIASRRPLKSRSLSMGHLNEDSSSTRSRPKRQSNKSSEGASSSGSRQVISHVIY